MSCPEWRAMMNTSRIPSCSQVIHPRKRMTRFALQFPNRFGARYHRRSAAESRFKTEKALFGDRLRCRRPTSRRNEVLAREIVHNVRLLTKGEPRPPAG